MRAPSIYTQSEVDTLLTMPKAIPWDDWQDARDSRPEPDTIVFRYVAKPKDAKIDAKFVLEVRANESADEIHILLHAEFNGKPSRAICRYDIHYGPHPNERRSCGNAIIIASREPHRHVYCAKCVAARKDWDTCSERLDLKSGGSLRAMIERLRARAIQELVIDIPHPDVSSQLFK